MLASHTIQTLTAPGEILPDSHFFFRGRFVLPAAGHVKIRLLAASRFEAWLDGAWLAEGPARFDRLHPEFQSLERELEAGEHLLALHVHYEGIETRLLEAGTPMFAFAEIDGAEIDWKCLPLDGAYRKTGRRIDCVLGWVEWCRTGKLPRGWRNPAFDDSGWISPRPLLLEAERFQRLDIGEIHRIRHRLDPEEEGKLVNMSVFTHDPTAGFVSRQLDDREFPAQGIWLRYDLGKVRLGRPEIRIDAPAGTVVQVAYCEFLNGGRVSPYISSSGGDVQSCNLDHFVLRGGEQVVKPLHPKGGRFMEIHVVGNPSAIQILEVLFEERVYYGQETEGSFSCSDDLLNQIWAVGIETLRSCSEDAITDNPTGSQPMDRPARKNSSESSRRRAKATPSSTVNAR